MTLTCVASVTNTVLDTVRHMLVNLCITQNYFFFSLLGDMGVQLSHNSLRDGARAVLNLIPADAHTSTKIRTLCTDLVKNPASNPQHGFDSLYFTTSPSQTLYNLDVCYR